MDLFATAVPGDDARCGYCREALGAAALCRCQGCGVRSHEACGLELGRSGCPTLGCAAGSTAPRRIDPVKVAPRSRWRRAARLLRAPALGLALGWLVLLGVERAREAAIPAVERAHAHCKRAQELSDTETKRLGLAGPIYLPESVMQDMIDEYSRALAADPTHLEALHDRAYWRWFSHDGAGALADYERLLELEPKNALAWYQRGRLRCERGEHQAAIGDYTRCLDLDGRHQHGAARSARASCRREVGDLVGALEDLQAEGGWDRLAIADLLQALGRHEEALRAYDAYLRANERSFDVRYRRGLSRFALGQVDGALEDFSVACADHGHSPSPRDTAQEHVAAHPDDPLSRVLLRALQRAPERE